MTAVDDDLSLATVYAAEDQVLNLITRGGIVDFYGSVLDLSECRVRSYEPWQIGFMQGVVNGLYEKHRDDRVPERPPVLRLSKRAVDACYRSGKHTITLPLQPWAWNDLVLCHEVAHALTVTMSRGNRTAHNYDWRKMYTSLVSEVIGPEAGLLLMNQLNL